MLLNFIKKCFDLEPFIKCNVNVSGVRWRCGSETCDQFVSYQDLQYCSFTQQVIEKHRHELSDMRNRVEVYEDGTFHLLPEVKPKYARRSKHNSNSISTANNHSEEDDRSLVAEPEEIDVL